MEQPPSAADRLNSVRIATRSELEVTRQILGGQPCYVVMDPVTFQSHKFTVDDYQIFVRLTDKYTLGEIFEQCVQLGLLSQTDRDGYFQFVMHLHQMGLLNLPVADGKSLYKRFQRRRPKGLSCAMQTLFCRVPLMCPDRFLDRTIGYVGVLFSRQAVAMWFVALLCTLWAVASQWTRFTGCFHTGFTMNNAPLLWALLISLKVFHEFGHAYACKRFGGNVPEIGAFFILFTPCAYIDASASWGFPNRFHRIVVALGGMYFESILTMLAVAVWSFTDAGWVNVAAHEVIVLSSVVTIAFNANPLLKYDGYYVLSDLLNLPNLRRDAQKAFFGVIKRLLYGVPVPKIGRRMWTRVWFVLFGAAATCYYYFVLAGIAMMLVLRVPVAGWLLAMLFLLAAFVTIGMKWLRFLVSSPELAGHRTRAAAVTGLLVAAIVGVLMVPLPACYSSGGIVRRRDERTVRANVDGFVDAVHVSDGQRLDARQNICRLNNHQLSAEVEQARAEMVSHRAQYHGLLAEDPALAAKSHYQWRKTSHRLTHLRRQIGSLAVASNRPGEVVLAEPCQATGEFVRQGDVLALVADGPWTVHAWIDDETMADTLLDAGTAVQVCVLGIPDCTFAGHVVRVHPSDQSDEDSDLTPQSSKRHTANTDDEQQSRYVVQIALAEHPGLDRLRRGMRALVRFGTPRQSPASRLVRSAQQFWLRFSMGN